MIFGIQFQVRSIDLFRKYYKQEELCKTFYPENSNSEKRKEKSVNFFIFCIFFEKRKREKEKRLDCTYYVLRIYTVYSTVSPSRILNPNTASSFTVVVEAQHVAEGLAGYPEQQYLSARKQGQIIEEGIDAGNRFCQWISQATPSFQVIHCAVFCFDTRKTGY
jgi:hypothetical protein